MAQKYWRNGKKLIPLDIWKISDLDILIEVGFAEAKPEGVYVKGSGSNFDWIIKMDAQRSFAGQKSAIARAKKYGTSAPLTNERSTNEPRTAVHELANEHERSTNEPRTDVKALTLTLTPTLKNTYTSSGDDGAREVKNSSQRKIPEKVAKLGELWNEVTANEKNLAKVKADKFSDRRINAIQKAIAFESSMDSWREVFSLVVDSDFLSGRLPGKTWCADFDWVVRPDRAERILEGTYTQRTSEPRRPVCTLPSIDDLDRRDREMKDPTWGEVTDDAC